MCQLLSLAAEYARQGDQETKQAIYLVYDRQEYQADWLGAEQIIALDGVAGFLHVAEVLGAKLLHDKSFVVDDELLRQADEMVGPEAVLARLTERAREDANVQAYRTAILMSRERSQQREPYQQMGLDEVLASIEKAEDRCIWLRRWAIKASPEELNALYERFLQETRPSHQARYLRAFARKPMPGISEKLFQLAESEDEDIRRAVMKALSNMHDDRVREFALRLLKSMPPNTDALDLLVKNYRQGDHLLLESSLPNEGEADVFHGAMMGLLRISSEVRDPNLSGCLLRAYEFSPCSMCRNDAVDKLIKVGGATREVLHECLWDCYGDTRKIARAALGCSEGLD
jgi:tRNA(Arg) A34 adenosine deaminase TadA